jgi:hypothetical protein
MEMEQDKKVQRHGEGVPLLLDSLPQLHQPLCMILVYNLYGLKNIVRVYIFGNSLEKDFFRDKVCNP